MARAANERQSGRVHVAAVFLANANSSWPYPGFDAQARQRKILGLLREGCPQIEFVPVTVEQPGEVRKATALKDQVTVYLAVLDGDIGKLFDQRGRIAVFCVCARSCMSLEEHVNT